MRPARHGDLPQEWDINPDLQRSIACFEMLAQTLLLLLARGQLAGGSYRIYIPPADVAPGGALHTESDNMPTVGAAAKAARPSARVAREWEEREPGGAGQNFPS